MLLLVLILLQQMVLVAAEDDEVNLGISLYDICYFLNLNLYEKVSFYEIIQNLTIRLVSSS